jgi:hypothetical protein
MSEWWSMQEAAWVGAIGGSLLGILGGTVGAASGIFAPRGRFRGAIVGSMGALAVIGAAVLIVGVVALSARQPYHVWYPMLLGGGILSLVCGCLLPVILMRYRVAEQRRMDAASLRRG